MSSLKNQADQLDASITVRLSTAEKSKLHEDAALAGISVSELVRRQYFNQPIMAQLDRSFFNGLFRMQSDIRKATGQLKHVHNVSNGIYSNLTAEGLRSANEILANVSTYMKALADDLQEDR